MTKQNGVDVWPNAAIWMRDELRSKTIIVGLSMKHLRFGGGLEAHGSSIDSAKPCSPRKCGF